MPVATIGIPTCNRAHLLKRVLECALEQDYSPLEILILDNCSTDETEAISRMLARADRRVRYVRQPRNVGAVHNFETALTEASGQYFMWLADDDWISPNYVSSCVDKLESEGHIMVVGKMSWRAAGLPPGTEAGQELATLPLVSKNPGLRVLSYIRCVCFNPACYNTVFYSVARTIDFRAALPFPLGIMGDVRMVADLLIRGTISVSERARIVRQQTVVKTDMNQLARLTENNLIPRFFYRITLAVRLARFVGSRRRREAMGGFWRQLNTAFHTGVSVWLIVGAGRDITDPVRRVIVKALPDTCLRGLRRLCRPVVRIQRGLKDRALRDPSGT